MSLRVDERGLYFLTFQVSIGASPQCHQSFALNLTAGRARAQTSDESNQDCNRTHVAGRHWRLKLASKSLRKRGDITALHPNETYKIADMRKNTADVVGV